MLFQSHFRDVFRKKTGLCGNISHTRGGRGGLTHSHLFMFVLPSFFACQNHPEVLKYVLQKCESDIWSIWILKYINWRAHRSGRRAGWCPSCRASDPCSGSSVERGQRDRGTCTLSFKHVPSPGWPFLRDQLVGQPRTTCWGPLCLPTVAFCPLRPSEIKPYV